MSDDHNPRAEVGDNRPPAPQKIFDDRLEGEHVDLRDAEMDLELSRTKLPQEVTSDDHVAMITAWVTRARMLGRDIEDRRKTAKEPYLERGRWIDGWFNKFRDGLLETAKSMEQRSTAYLVAKKRREEEEARAAAKRAAEERAKAAAEAAAAQRKRDEAAAAAQRAQEALTAAAARQTAPEVTARAEAQFREATQAETAAAAQLEQAHKGVRMTELAQDRAERRAEAPERLGEASGGGGNARVEMVPGYRVVSWPKLQQSLGPLGSYVDVNWFDAPLTRWAKIAQGKPADRTLIPGVEWFESPETKTTATRTPARGHYVSDRDG